MLDPIKYGIAKRVVFFLESSREKCFSKIEVQVGGGREGEGEVEN